MSESLPLPRPFHKRATLRGVEGSKDGGADHVAPDWHTPRAPQWHIVGESVPEWRPLQKESHK